MAVSHNEKLQDTRKIYDLPYFERSELCKIFNQNNKWEELAGKWMQFDMPTIRNLRKKENPTDELLTLWSTYNHTIVELFALFLKMKNYKAMVPLKSSLAEKYHVLIDKGLKAIRLQRVLDEKNKAKKNSSNDRKIGVENCKENVVRPGAEKSNRNVVRPTEKCNKNVVRAAAENCNQNVVRPSLNSNHQNVLRPAQNSNKNVVRAAAENSNQNVVRPSLNSNHQNVLRPAQNSNKDVVRAAAENSNQNVVRPSLNSNHQNVLRPAQNSNKDVVRAAAENSNQNVVRPSLNSNHQNIVRPTEKCNKNVVRAVAENSNQNVVRPSLNSNHQNVLRPAQNSNKDVVRAAAENSNQNVVRPSLNSNHQNVLRPAQNSNKDVVRAAAENSNQNVVRPSLNSNHQNVLRPAQNSNKDVVRAAAENSNQNVVRPSLNSNHQNIVRPTEKCNKNAVRAAAENCNQNVVRAAAENCNQNVVRPPVIPKVVAADNTRGKTQKIVSQPRQQQQQQQQQQLVLPNAATGPKNISSLPPVMKTESTLPEISYQELAIAANQWSRWNILGSGGFATVYRGTWKNTEVAIKRVECRKPELVDSGRERIKMQQTLMEIEILNSRRHENILTLYAFSLDGEAPCLVYQMMQNGSLEDRLHLRHGTEPLTWMQRLDIAKGTARGLQYLHTIGNKPFIHGDIKSANILLDKFFQPKIGDFGLARKGPQNQSVKVSHIYGTRPYLPEDYLLGKSLSTKIDTYSYGIVMFEIGTGLLACDKTRPTNKLLKDFVDSWNDQDLENQKDFKAGIDHRGIYPNLMLIGKWCSNKLDKDRPEMEAVFRKIKDLD